MILKEIKNKKIELFVENEIDRYKKNLTISPVEMVETYLNSEGFIVFVNIDNKFIGYLEKSDINKLSEIINNQNSSLIKNIKQLLDDNKLKLKEDYIDYSEKLINVLNKLNNSPQIFFPVIKNNYLIGRVSKDKLKKRIDEIYSNTRN